MGILNLNFWQLYMYKYQSIALDCNVMRKKFGSKTTSLVIKVSCLVLIQEEDNMPKETFSLMSRLERMKQKNNYVLKKHFSTLNFHTFAVVCCELINYKVYILITRSRVCSGVSVSPSLQI